MFDGWAGLILCRCCLAHTNTHTQICKYRCMHTDTWIKKLYRFKHSHPLYCMLDNWAICGQMLLQSPSVHIRIYQRHREGREWGRTGINLVEWRQPCQMTLPSPIQLRLIKLICHQGNLSSLVIKNTLSLSVSVFFLSCTLMPFFTSFPWWLTLVLRLCLLLFLIILYCMY